MKIRRIAATAGASLLVSLCAESIALADTAADPTVVITDAPSVLGDGQPPLEFSATVANLGEGGRLRFGAEAAPGLLFGPEAIALDIQNIDGSWQPIDLTSADPSVAVVNGELQLRIAFDSGQTTEPPTTGAGDPVPETSECSDILFGFVLDATLISSEQAVATAHATIQVGNAAAKIEGLDGAKIVAGGLPHSFTVELCNGTDSSYADLAIALSVVHGSIDSGPFEQQFGLSQVILETSTNGLTWLPVQLHVSEGPSDVLFSDCGPRFDLPPRTTARPVRFRLGFTTDVKPSGPGWVPGTLHASSCGAAGDVAEFQIHPPSAPTRPMPTPKPPSGHAGAKLPATGAGSAVLYGVVGAWLVACGICLVALLGVRRRTRHRTQSGH
jgi:hypothetical protein